jgi:TRAP transporter TAXI family solute receptor
LYFEVCEVIVDSKTEINTIEQLKGKRVAIGKTGSRQKIIAEQILSAYDITLDDIDAKDLNLTEALEAMKNKEIDAFFYMGDVKSSIIDEFSKTNSVSVLSIEDEELRKLC